MNDWIEWDEITWVWPRFQPRSCSVDENFWNIIDASFNANEQRRLRWPR